MKPIIVIHGWSDESSSFEDLSHRLKDDIDRDIQDLWLGDYVSMDDDVKLADVAIAMQRAWKFHELPTDPNSVDVIIHSTGGLVVRLWMHMYYSSEGNRPPVQNLVMLAPANFGSPLAHTGRSIMGRVFKGRNSEKRFQTGAHILKGLEMASPFTWNLAMFDRFEPSNPFSEGGVVCTVIVGNRGYRGIQGIVNKPGSDGTVYVSTANLNCARVDIEVNPETGELTSDGIKHSYGNVAFRLLDNYDHGTITEARDEPIEAIIRSLEVEMGESFDAWCEDCALETRAVMEKYEGLHERDQHGYQNTVFRVIDNQDAFVDDYLIEFYGNFDNDEDRWAERFNRDITAKVHSYKDNCAYKSFMVNTTCLHKVVEDIDESLRISMTASPDISDERTLAGYKTFGVDDIGCLELSPEQLQEYFQPNRTVLINILLPRHQKDRVFKLKKLAD
jgi:hypothetical protein